MFAVWRRDWTRADGLHAVDGKQRQLTRVATRMNTCWPAKNEHNPALPRRPLAELSKVPTKHESVLHQS